MSELCDLTATQLRQMIGRKDISPVELVDACIERVERAVSYTHLTLPTILLV